MFQEKDIEAYQSIKAPVELKNRIKLSVKQQRKKDVRKSIAWVSAAACLAIVLFSGAFLRTNSTIISVNDRMVSYEAVEINRSSGYGLATANVGRSSAASLQIPLEIAVTEKAHISVSQGTLKNMVETDSEWKEITEMDISKPAVIYWTITGDINDIPICTIITEGKEYSYVIEFNERDSVYTIKQIK